MILNIKIQPFQTKLYNILNSFRKEKELMKKLYLRESKRLGLDIVALWFILLELLECQKA